MRKFMPTLATAWASSVARAAPKGPQRGINSRFKTRLTAAPAAARYFSYRNWRCAAKKILRAMPRQEKAGRQAATHRIPQAGQYAWP